jgi:hypothetical protein
MILPGAGVVMMLVSLYNSDSRRPTTLLRGKKKAARFRERLEFHAHWTS